MRKNYNRLRKRIFKVIWSGIIVVSLYLIFRFAALSFSDNVGQADFKLTDAIFSGLCNKVMGDGASLISYSMNEDQLNFPVGFGSPELALSNFTDDTSLWTVQAQGHAFMNEGGMIDSTAASVEAMSTEDIHNEIGFYEIPKQYLSLEYVLTNGAVYNSAMAGEQLTEGSYDQLQIGYEDGEVNLEDGDSSEDAAKPANADGAVIFTLDQLKDKDFLIHNFYIVDKTTSITDNLFDGEKLIGIDMTMKQENDAPQILIYHTHSQEAFIDSRAGNPEDSVVGVGSRLADILTNDYGYNVIHDTTTYDIVNGSLNRNVAYTKAEEGLDKILKENPSIEVTIDLHRDSGSARTVEINGKDTAKVMLFNGLSRNQNGPLTDLPNPNLENNLAFSLQLQLKSDELYPGFFNKNYLKSYRYNLQVRPKALLVELGTDKNTVESAKNAMAPFAKVLDAVLQGE